MTISESSPEQVIKDYICGTFEGDVSALKDVFHQDAHMAGFIGGEASHGTPQPFFDAIAANPSVESSGAPYEAEITHLATEGDIASATLVEKGLMGMTFTNHFHLMREGGQWRIVSKTYKGS